ncbi:MAG: hypothetical protein RLY92_1098 [Chloroflexota bacterium]
MPMQPKQLTPRRSSPTDTAPVADTRHSCWRASTGCFHSSAAGAAAAGVTTTISEQATLTTILRLPVTSWLQNQASRCAWQAAHRPRRRSWLPTPTSARPRVSGTGVLATSPACITKSLRIGLRRAMPMKSAFALAMRAVDPAIILTGPDIHQFVGDPATAPQEDQARQHPGMGPHYSQPP